MADRRVKPACPRSWEGADDLMPMHFLLGAEGEVLSAGRTLRRILSPDDPVGRPGAAFLRLRRPAGADLLPTLRDCAGLPLRLELAGEEAHGFVGVSAATAEGGAVLNLSFGIGIVEAVRRWGLTMDDFAPTDLAAEILFLVEANALMLSEAHEMAEGLDAAHVAAKREAETDPLTGLANRRALARAVDGLARSRRPFTLLSLDLDRFKAVNDRWGHDAGDAVLRAVAARLLSEGRRDDLAVRLGGDEFVLLVRGLPSGERLAEIALVLIASIEAAIPLPGGAGPACVSASIGIVRSDMIPDGDLNALLAAADRRLYRAKEGGRGRAVGA